MMRICLAEKNNLDCVDHGWIRMAFFFYLLFLVSALNAVQKPNNQSLTR